MDTISKIITAKISMNANRIYTTVIQPNPRVSINLDHMNVNVIAVLKCRFFTNAFQSIIATELLGGVLLVQQIRNVQILKVDTNANVIKATFGFLVGKTTV